MRKYNGNQQGYIYLSFAKTDEEIVNKYLQPLSDEGIAFCYDDKFNKKETDNLFRSNAVLLFLTKQYVKEKKLRDTVTCAIKYEKPILCIYLQDVELDACLTMQTEAQQALFINKFQNDEEFINALKQSSIFKNVQVIPAQKNNQRNRSLFTISGVVLAGLLFFVFVLKPLLISNTSSEEMKFLGLQGLSKQDLESITELRVIGNRVVDTFVHGWYENGDRTLIYYEQEVDGQMVRQEAVVPGTISDLSDLKQLKNLKELQIEGQQITDISPLYELENLEALSINCNPISSLAGIDKLEKLTWLDICATDVTDLSDVFKLQNLNCLQIDITYIDNLDGIEELGNLSEIQLNGTYVNQIPKGINANIIYANGARLTAIPDFNGKENVQFFANSNNFRNYSNLNTAKSYEYLQIQGDYDSNELIDALTGIPVDCFVVAGLRIDSIKELYPIDIKTVINISHSSISSLEGIEYFESVKNVDLKYDTNLTDLTPLNEMPNLESVTLSDDLLWMADQLDERIEVNILNLNYSPKL